MHAYHMNISRLHNKISKRIYFSQAVCIIYFEVKPFLKKRK